jgi:hypothetical protein
MNMKYLAILLGACLGLAGCVVTCVAMLAGGHGYPETPKTINGKFKAVKGFVGANLVWGKLSEIHPQIRTRELVTCYNIDAPLEKIDAALAAGQPVIVQVDMSPAPGLQRHWVLLYEKKAGDYQMLDPWPYPAETGQSVPFLPRYGQGRPLERAISVVILYECLTPGDGALAAVPGTFVQVSAGAQAGLRLRSAPNTGSATLTVEPPLTQLEVLDAGDLAKIERPYQWMRVRDDAGLEGYVAAWYVELSEPAPPPVSAPAPPPSTPASEPVPPRLVVVVSPNVGKKGLRLRKTPSKAGALTAIEKAGTRLTVIETEDKARPKIGAARWLYVRDPKGRRGYVLGLYVRLARSGATERSAHEAQFQHSR